MRFVIDCEKNVIRCPKAFFTMVETKNTILKENGLDPVNHKDELKKFFDKAIEHELIRIFD